MLCNRFAQQTMQRMVVCMGLCVQLKKPSMYSPLVSVFDSICLNVSKVTQNR